MYVSCIHIFCVCWKLLILFLIYNIILYIITFLHIIRMFKKRWCYISGSSYITVLPPIPTAGLTKDDLPKLMEQTYEVMNKTFVESTTECLEEQIRSLKCEWLIKNNKVISIHHNLNSNQSMSSWLIDLRIENSQKNCTCELLRY